MIQKTDSLDPVLDELKKTWPKNRTVNIVCHGHSVPAGYFATPYVNTFNSYPHLLHQIITAIGGENSVEGESRFERDVLSHSPDIITIDYSLNDRSVGLKAAEGAWSSMIEKALARGIKVILCTPTWDNSFYVKNEKWDMLLKHAEQVRVLADRYNVGLADSFKVFESNITEQSDLAKFLSHVNHPSRAGHELVAYEIAKYFIAR